MIGRWSRNGSVVGDDGEMGGVEGVD